MIFRSFALFRHVVFRPAPNRYAQAAQYGQDGKEIAVDRFKRSQLRILKPPNIPFAQAEAGIFKIIVARSVRGDEHVVRGRISVNRNESERQCIQGGNDAIVGGQKKPAIRSVERRQRRSTLQRGAAPVDLAPERWRLTREVGERIVNTVERLCRARHVRRVFPIRRNMLDVLPQGQRKTVMEMRAGRKVGSWGDNPLLDEMPADLELSAELFLSFDILRSDNSRNDIRWKEGDADMLGVMQDRRVNAIDPETMRNRGCGVQGSN